MSTANTTTTSGPTAFPAPVVMAEGATDAAAPLVVLLHGRGSTEAEILSLVPHLPRGLAYAAVRAPIAEGGGFAWFANHGIGRPDAASLAATMSWFTQWLDEVAPPGRPVFLIGFSGGAAFAGGLVLADPSRYVGAAILYGTLPFDAGLAADTGRLANLPMFLAHGEADQVIPRELLDRTWRYLLAESGAPTVARRDPGGHRITAATLHRLSGWLADRVHFLAAHEPIPTGFRETSSGPFCRRGPAAPSGSAARGVVVHSPAAAVAECPRRPAGAVVRAGQLLGGRLDERSQISVPGARAFVVSDAAGRPDDAFLVPGVGEFAHLHPDYDGSLHLALRAPLAADLVARGWGAPHPWAGTRLAPGFVMLFGPRTSGELETVVASSELPTRSPRRSRRERARPSRAPTDGDGVVDTEVVTGSTQLLGSSLPGVDDLEEPGSAPACRGPWVGGVTMNLREARVHRRAVLRFLDSAASGEAPERCEIAVFRMRRRLPSSRGEPCRTSSLRPARPRGAPGQ